MADEDVCVSMSMMPCVISLTLGICYLFYYLSVQESSGMLVMLWKTMLPNRGGRSVLLALPPGGLWRTRKTWWAKM